MHGAQAWLSLTPPRRCVSLQHRTSHGNYPNLSRFRFGECIARAIGSLGIAAPTAHGVQGLVIVQATWADLGERDKKEPSWAD